MVLEFVYQDIPSSTKITNDQSQDNIQQPGSFGNYWETPIHTTVEKKTMTYDDILSSLNLVVSSDGVLKKMSSKNINSGDFFNSNSNNIQPSSGNIQPTSGNHESRESNGFRPAQFRPPSSQNKKVKIDKRIDPGLKNSAIYNKYFKGYKDIADDIVPRRPLTQQELKKQLIEERIMALYQKKRVAHIKSKQLSFTSELGPIRPRNGGYENHLFKFSKR